MNRERTFFTSDTHFGHANIIKYSKRPFANADDMDEALIESWNQTVGEDDVIYHLGDFTLAGFGFARSIFLQLNGRIRVLGYPWHHDKRWLPKGDTKLYSRGGHAVEILPPMIAQSMGGQWIVMCHYPLGEWDRKHHGSWHLHGHSHGTYAPRGAMMDVGVDCTGYAPIRLEALADRITPERRESPARPHL